ncbi:30010_t:CDS:2, partial [Racocetra persica]
SSQWTKILNHSNFPEYKFRLREPHLCDKAYSGYIDVKDKHLFFWFFESRSNPQEDPIVLWPIDTGYSYGDADVSNSFTAAHDVYVFLQIFFQEFRQYANLDFHISGISYAGHFVIAIASDINKYNNVDNSIKNHIHINLKSILIGNALVNAPVQYKYYPDMACDSSYGPVVDDSGCNQMRRYYIQCIKLTKTCYDSKNVTDCVTAENCFERMALPYWNTHRSFFDIRKYRITDDSDSCYYPELHDIAKYSNREDVKTELGVNPSIQRFDIYVPSLLESKIRILVYAGCEAWTKALKWSGTKGFNNANVTRWITTYGTYSGDVRTFKGLTFLGVFKAGHYVTHDQPIASFDFFNKWIFNKD